MPCCPGCGGHVNETAYDKFSRTTPKHPTCGPYSSSGPYGPSGWEKQYQPGDGDKLFAYGPTLLLVVVLLVQLLAATE